jgi:hypothetical protein
MKGEQCMGYAPEDEYWSPDEDLVYFTWGLEMELLESDYSYNIETGEISKLSIEDRKERLPRYGLSYNKKRDKILFSKHGNLYSYEIESKDPILLLDLSDNISNPSFSVDEESCYFVYNNNLYTLQLETGRVDALTQFKQGAETPEKKEYSNDQEEWLYLD